MISLKKMEEIMKKSLIFVGLLACWLVGLVGCASEENVSFYSDSEEASWKTNFDAYGHYVGPVICSAGLDEKCPLSNTKCADDNYVRDVSCYGAVGVCFGGCESCAKCVSE